MCIDYLVQEGVLPLLEGAPCDNYQLRRYPKYRGNDYVQCTGVLRFWENQGHGRYFRCSNKACRKVFNILSGTVFESCRLELRKAILIAVLWLCDCKRQTIATLCGVSSKIVTDWVKSYLHIVAGCRCSASPRTNTSWWSVSRRFFYCC